MIYILPKLKKTLLNSRYICSEACIYQFLHLNPRSRGFYINKYNLDSNQVQVSRLRSAYLKKKKIRGIFIKFFTLESVEWKKRIKISFYIRNINLHDVEARKKRIFFSHGFWRNYEKLSSYTFGRCFLEDECIDNHCTFWMNGKL